MTVDKHIACTGFHVTIQHSISLSIMSLFAMIPVSISRNPGEIFTRRQNSAFKNHPRDILRDENQLYGIVLVHIVHKTALNTTKRLQVARY